MLDTGSPTETSNGITGQRIEFAAGPARLTGTLYLPAGHPAVAVVLNGATGVPQDYYAHFARWLAEHRGMACLTYDYRDFGASASKSPRASSVDMADWALVDQPAARDEMRRRFPGLPLWVIGHSLGAMLLPLQDGIKHIDRVIGVASGLVYPPDHPWPYRLLARLFWYGHVPLIVRLAGYLPGRLVGFGADLPANVYWQWRRWCTRRDSYLPETGKSLPRADWSRSTAPVDLFALADDLVIPPHSVRKLARVYGDEAVRQHLLDPADHGLGVVGHLGLFRRRNAALWAVLLDAAATTEATAAPERQ